MALLKQWRDMAYDEKANKGDIQRFWANYFNIEKGIYEQLLTDPDTEVKGTVKELAEKYGQSVMTMTGFLDGINDSLVEPNPIEEMEEDLILPAFRKLKFGTATSPSGAGSYTRRSSGRSTAATGGTTTRWPSRPTRRAGQATTNSRPALRRNLPSATG